MWRSGGAYVPPGMRTQLIRVDRPNRRIRPVTGGGEQSEAKVGNNGTDVVHRTLVLEFDS
eukprot:SAG22_NODE_1375_length_4557_cov_4.997208_3_plen_60_part_00